METGLVRKVFTLIVLSILLYVAFLVSGSLAVLSDALYSLVDALFVFSLWISLIVVVRRHIGEFELRMVSLSVLILSLLFIFTSSILIYSSILGLRSHSVAKPEVVVAAELLFVFILSYVYISLREEAAEEHLYALSVISKDVERNILASLLVIIAALFSMIGLGEMDAVASFFIASYVLYRSLVLSYSSFRSLIGVSDPVLVEMIKERVMGAGLRLVGLKVLGIGPFYYVKITVDASHLPDRWEKVEELLKNRVAMILPSSARIDVESPGGGI